MDSIFQQILKILVEPPGNLVYYLVIVVAVMAGLQAVSFTHSERPSTTTRRLFLGFGLVLAGQIVLFATSALGWQQVIDPQIILPLLDRAMVFVSLVTILWMWAFPRANRLTDILSLVIGLLAVPYFVIGLAIWTPLAGVVHFNHSSLDWIWSLAVLALAITGLLILVIRRRPQWGSGAGFFTLIAAGALAHIFWADPQNDFPAFLRLAQVCVFPLLPAVARLTQPELAAGIAPDSADYESAALRKFHIANPTVVVTWLGIIRIQEPDKIGPAVVQGIARSLVADMAFIISAADTRSPILIQCGYDLIREETVTGTLLDHEKAPLISAVLQRKKPLLISQDTSDSPKDLHALAQVLGLKEVGALMLIPTLVKNSTWSGILVISPYSRHEWDDGDQSFLQSISEEIGNVLSIAVDRINKKLQNEELISGYNDTLVELEQARREKDQLRQEIVTLQEEQDLYSRQSIDYNGLLAIQKEAQLAISRLESENNSLREALQDLQKEGISNKEAGHFESELRKSLEEIARLQNTLAKANMQILDLQQHTNLSGTRPAGSKELIIAVSQDLRQPISSILGYTDLLMGESVGILGALQRKFLDRIKVSAEKMRFHLEELLERASASTDPLELTTQPVDLDDVLDQAMDDIRDLLKEKNINLLMDVPEGLPYLYTDRDSIYQVFIQLLQNAANATPAEGNISLQMHLEQNSPSETFLLFQVTDDGGGIATGDLKRVFFRRYRDANAPIPGTGDNGIGLSIARSIVEAHGGRIWVESDPGRTSTFSILLPTQPSRVTPSSTL